MRRLIAGIVSVILLLSLALPAFAEEATEDITVTSPSAILMEQETGSILWEKNPHEKRHIASVTKIMTMLLIMESIDRGELKMDDIVTVSEHAKSMGGSTIYLETGEQMSVHDILKGIAVMSANDGCVAMAEHIAGSEEAFVSLMNQRAKELGMNDTHFSNTNGLVDEDHYSSAYDVAVMSRELMRHKKITEFTTIWMDSLRDGKFQLANTNKLVKYYKGATGLKTGFTQKSMYCLSATATRSDMSLIAVVLGAPTSKERFADASKLLNYGFNGFVIQKGVKKGENVTNVPLQRGIESSVLAQSKENFNLLVKKSEQSKLTYEISFSDPLSAPIKRGDTIGFMTFYQNKTKVGKVDLVASKDVKRQHVGHLFVKVMRFFLCNQI